VDLSMAAKLHAESAAALVEATVELEGALMAPNPDVRRRAGERYDEARLHEARCLTDLVRTRRAHARPLLSVLADPTVRCDPDSSVLASIIDYAAAKPASAGLDVRRATGDLYTDPGAAASRCAWPSFAAASGGSADRRFGFPLTASG
jgi:hypothetical protein